MTGPFVDWNSEPDFGDENTVVQVDPNQALLEEVDKTPLPEDGEQPWESDDPR